MAKSKNSGSQPRKRTHPKAQFQNLPQPLPSVSKMGEFQQAALRELQAELASRRIEALKMYVPTPEQQAFHECMSSERLVIGGNRSGKSLSTFVEDARAVTGQDPYGKYPEKDGVLAIVGKDWRHIGMVVYPLLFKAGAFRIIRDQATNEWRAYSPKTDSGRKGESKPAPPLIPPRMIKSMSWILKSANYIQRCELTNGWTIYFFSSEGTPPQGYQCNLFHVDEDVENEAWIPEGQARLADRKGRFVWSAMPHSKNDALIGLAERADRAAESGDPTPIIKKFTLPFLSNPHIDDDEKRKAIERWSAQGMDVLRQRSEGEFVTDSIMVYPTWNTSVHLYDRTKLPAGVVPDDWCRVLAVDPGHAVTAVLFAAVPPDESMILVYDELYLRNCNAVQFGERLKEKITHTFHAFIIDMHGARITDIGSGVSVIQQYCNQLRDRGIESETTGHSFLPGCDDILSRTSAVRTALHIRGDGTTRLKVLQGSCPNLERELRRYKKKVNYVNGIAVVTDMPNTRGEVHACQALEYIVAYNPKYHRPSAPAAPEPWYVDWMRKRKAKKGPGYVYLGPQSGLLEEDRSFEGN